MFVRVLSTECLKLKRTLALWMALIAPMAMVLLQFAITYKRAGELQSTSKDAWSIIVHQTIEPWTLLLMPLFVTLETSLLAGLENTEKNWKSLLALPAPRWTIYISKLVVAVGLLWLAHAVLIGETSISARLLKALFPGLNLGTLPLTPFLMPMIRVSVAALLGVTIQHWVSLRWQSFTAAMGFGMCAMIFGVFASNSPQIGTWFPWSLPIHAVLHGAAGNDGITFWSLGGAILVAMLGCWEFTKREII